MSPSPADFLSATTCAECRRFLRGLCMLLDSSVHTVWVTQRCRRCTKQSSTPDCCSLPAPDGASPRPQTGSVSRDFYVVVCVLDTAEQTNGRLRSWLKIQTTGCSTESGTTVTTSCSRCCPTVALTLISSASDVITSNYSANRTLITNCNFIARLLFKDSQWS